MESKIIKQEKNPFLQREELTMEIKSEIAPSFEQVKKEIGKDADLTVVKNINGNFGKQVFTIEAVIYDSKEAKEQVETIPKKIKKKLAEEAKAAGIASKKAAAEAKKAEEAAKAAAEEAAKTEAEAPVEEPITEEQTE